MSSAELRQKIRDTIDAPVETELDTARAMRAGDLSSPQQIGNSWLVDMRITGTGTAYRQGLDEYAYRAPENYLTAEFCARCNGLPVIFGHPEEGMLNTDEYRQRSIGSIVLPYVQGSEVRGIARVYDADAMALMEGDFSSTSPAVVFSRGGSTLDVVLANDMSVMIEGKPAFLDHLAVVPDGVWDKGATPTGIKHG